MPPPKKPKTGPTRVDAFMTTNEIDDLKRDLMTKLPLMWSMNASKPSSLPAEGSTEAWRGDSKEPAAAAAAVVEEAEDLSMWPKSRQSSPPAASRCTTTILNDLMHTAPLKTNWQQQKLLAKLLHELPTPATRYLNGDRRCAQASRVGSITEPAISKLSALMVESCPERRLAGGAVSLVTRMSPDTRWHSMRLPHTAHMSSSSELLKLVGNDCNLDSKSRLQMMLASRKHCRTDTAAATASEYASEFPAGSWPSSERTQEQMSSGDGETKLTQREAKIPQSVDDVKFGQRPPGGMPPDLINLGCAGGGGGGEQSSTTDQLDRLSDSSYELPSSTMDECAKPTANVTVGPKDGRQCQICNDTASGFHYGVWSCEGCKAFFKRSLQGPVDYVCPATNNCKIDKFRRKSCQACRLGKCLEMGMSKGNCRKEKGSRNQKTTGKRCSDSKEHEQHDVKKFKGYGDDASPAVSAMPVHCIQHAPAAVTAIRGVPHNSAPCHPPTEHHPPMHPLVEHLLQIDPPVRMSGHDNSQPDSERHLVASIVKLVDIELVDIINWAKAFPGYADFQLKDRVHLLEVCWTEVIVCGLVWRSINSVHNRVLIVAPDLHLDRERSHVSHLWPTSDAFLALCNCFHRLTINREEFVLIRALVLLNAEVSLQDCDDKWHSLRRRVTNALDYTVCARCDPNVTTHDPNTTPRDRLAQILLLLPHMRVVAGEFFSWLSKVKDEYAGPFCELLREMIDVRASAVTFDR